MMIQITREELKAMITEIVDEQLRKIHQTTQQHSHNILNIPPDTRTQEEVRESIRRNRWTPPPGSRSTLALLREDRDR
ncbi:MAG: hypothetical protein MUF87_14490 [Anaerolineae bacterium]|nr:hypothetical protein [Anaerolineae bacterium]